MSVIFKEFGSKTAKSSIYTKVTFFDGYFKLETKLPDVTENFKRYTEEEIYDLNIANGLLAFRPDDRTKAKKFAIRVIVKLGNNMQMFLMDTKEAFWYVDLPKNSAGKTVTITYASIDIPLPYHGFAEQFKVLFLNNEISFTVPVETTDIKFSPFGEGELLESILIKDGATELAVVAAHANGVKAYLVDSIEYEIPAKLWLPEIVDVCPFREDADLEKERAVCRFFKVNKKPDPLETRDSTGTMMCPLRSVVCNGYKQSCALYRPSRRCAALLCRRNWNEVGHIQFNDNDSELLFNNITGLGYIPLAAWKHDQTLYQELIGGLFTAMDLAFNHYCHKFETKQENRLPCLAFDTLALPKADIGTVEFWRYADVNGNLDTTFLKGTHVKVGLFDKDMFINNPHSVPPSDTFMTHGLFGSKYVGSNRLTPSAYIPRDLPRGVYNIWMYGKNTSKQPRVLKSVPVRYGGSNLLYGGEWKIPYSDTEQWIKLEPLTHSYNTVLDGGMMLTFGYKPGNELGHFDVEGFFDDTAEFYFKSFFLEREF